MNRIISQVKRFRPRIEAGLSPIAQIEWPYCPNKCVPRHDDNCRRRTALHHSCP